MRFISKNSNLRIILKPGLPSSPLTGALAVPTLFVKFQNGEAHVEDEHLIMAMKGHIGFNTDFIAVEEGTRDPFSNTRSDIEPVHHITEMKYGHAEKRYSTPQKFKLSPEMEALIQLEAMKIAKEMLPAAVNAVLNEAKANIKAEKEAVAQPVETEKTEESEEFTFPDDLNETKEDDTEVVKKSTKGRPKKK